MGNNQCSRTATPCAGATPDRIHALTNVEVITGATAIGLEGHDGMLQAARWRLSTTGQEIRQPVGHLFSFIGAEANTDWLNGSGVTLDPKGFVLTGNDAGDGRHLLGSLLDFYKVNPWPGARNALYIKAGDADRFTSPCCPECA